MPRPKTELFLLMSVDGKISTGDTDDFDVDKDIPRIPGDPSAGLHQYYEEELETSLWPINSGRVLAKVGVNEKPIPKDQEKNVNFVVLDNNHLNSHGVEVMSKRSKMLVIVTSNKSHPVYKLKSNLKNITIIEYKGEMNPVEILNKLGELGCKEATIQTGGTLNNMWLRSSCIDLLNIVVTPILVGGKTVSTLIDGPAAKSLSDLRGLELISVKKMKNSYLQLRYKVNNPKQGKAVIIK